MPGESDATLEAIGVPRMPAKPGESAPLDHLLSCAPHGRSSPIAAKPARRRQHSRRDGARRPYARFQREAAPARRDLLEEIGAGLRWLRSKPLIRFKAFLTGGINLVN